MEKCEHNFEQQKATILEQRKKLFFFFFEQQNPLFMSKKKAFWENKITTKREKRKINKNKGRNRQ